jgi:hypothetical protein
MVWIRVDLGFTTAEDEVFLKFLKKRVAHPVSLGY